MDAADVPPGTRLGATASSTPRVVVVAYAVGGALAAAYAVSLLVRPNGRSWTALDN